MGTIKNGHYIRECRSLKNWKKEEEGNNEANLVEDIVAMVLEIQGLWRFYRWTISAMGNHNATKVHGRDVVEIKMSSGKKIGFD